MEKCEEFGAAKDRWRCQWSNKKNLESQIIKDIGFEGERTTRDIGRIKGANRNPRILSSGDRI